MNEEIIKNNSIVEAPLQASSTTITELLLTKRYELYTKGRNKLKIPITIKVISLLNIKRNTKINFFICSLVFYYFL